MRRAIEIPHGRTMSFEAPATAFFTTRVRRREIPPFGKEALVGEPIREQLCDIISTSLGESYCVLGGRLAVLSGSRARIADLHHSIAMSLISRAQKQLQATKLKSLLVDCPLVLIFQTLGNVRSSTLSEAINDQLKKTSAASDLVARSIRVKNTIASQAGATPLTQYFQVR